MLFQSRILACSALLAGLLAITSTPAAAAGVEMFTFTGVCFDCSGTGTAVLTVADTYVPGNSLSVSDFFSLTYYPTNLLPSGISITADILRSISGGLPTALTGDAALDIAGIGGTGEFITTTDGHWYVCQHSCGDFGTSYTWSAGAATLTPEPSTLALTGLGWAALTLVRRRRL